MKKFTTNLWILVLLFLWIQLTQIYRYHSAVGNNTTINNNNARLHEEEEFSPFKISLPTLEELTSSSSSFNSGCSNGLFYRSNVHNNATTSTATTNNKIPKIIHQTSKSRCLGSQTYEASILWSQLDGYSYYFHDDEAVMRLLTEVDFVDDVFIKLRDIAKYCPISGTAKADVWRYLVLWMYGGIYSDIDSEPALFNASSILPNDDGYFVVERFDLLSQWFMAVAPRHPLMYYALHSAINNIMTTIDTSFFNAALVTGPHALHRGMQEFMYDSNTNNNQLINEKTKEITMEFPLPIPRFGPIHAGIYYGTFNKSIRVVGDAQNESEHVNRDIFRDHEKEEEYKLMNITHFQNYYRDNNEHIANRTCHSMILHNKFQN